MPPIIIDLFIALLGFACGALVNYLSDVLPLRRQIVRPFCLHCGEKMTWINYLFWPRRCLKCDRRRAWRTWVVEVAAVIVTLWLWISPPARLGFVLGLILLVYFGVVVIIDIEYRLILQPVSIVGAILALVIGIQIRGVLVTLLGGFAGFGLMWLFYFLGLQFTNLIYRIQGKPLEEGLGFGDVTLSGVLGLLFGWPGVVVALFLGVLIGAAIGLLYLLLMAVTRRFKAFATMPYGPYLVASAVILLYFRDFVLGLMNRYWDCKAKNCLNVHRCSNSFLIDLFLIKPVLRTYLYGTSVSILYFPKPPELKRR
jgi:prepilin signal peptidase PulO-like enzyme (type II secretory pathway)